MKKIINAVLIAIVIAFGMSLLLKPVAAETGSLGLQPNQPNAQDKLERIKQLSLEYLQNKSVKEGTDRGGSEMTVKSVQIDGLGMSHTRVRQTIKGVPVWQSEAIVHLKADESLFTITDNLISNRPVNTDPQLSPEQALAAAFRLEKGEASRLRDKTQPELWIIEGKKELQLVYRIQLQSADNSNEPHLPVYFIDAQTGKKVFGYDDLQTQSVTGFGSSLYSGTVSFTTFQYGAPYYLENFDRRLGTFYVNTSNHFSDPDNFWGDPVQQAAVDAHWGAEKTFEYYQNVFGRNGIDGNGGPLSVPGIDGVTYLLPSKVHYGANYNNAFWDGSSMTYGDGDGSTFTPLISLDVVGHEMTHGVTQYTAGLTYSGESGALNESMSDVFGAMIERYAKGESSDTWKIGEQIYTPTIPGDALRFMDNPHAASNKGYTADDDPDHYSERYTGPYDNGGVHINSGISNNAFYLLAHGGSHHLGGSMNGIGADKAAQIWYLALTGYMTSGTNFAQARTAAINASNALYGGGSNESNAVAQAWCLVGVGSCNAPPADCGLLLPNQSLAQGQSVTACNGVVTLVFQGDGNVVLYKYTGEALWSSVTWGRPDATVFVMQGDGNLVLYAGGTPLWDSQTWGNPGAYLAVQDDSNAVIYSPSGQPLWATNTSGR